MENEIWKDAVGFEGFYKISNSGRVLSMQRIIKNKRGKNYTVSEKILRQPINSHGYVRYSLMIEGHLLRSSTAHRLVAIAFIPNPENKPHVNHIDGNKLNNHVSNLEWCTLQENAQHAFNNGLVKKMDIKRRKLSECQILTIREFYNGSRGQITTLSKKHKVTRATIRDIINKKTYILF